MISLVIPVYKNSENITPLLEALTELNLKLGGEFEVVFVVDGSPDDSYLRLDRGLRKVPFTAQLLCFSRNFGSFAAIRAGLAFVPFALAITAGTVLAKHALAHGTPRAIAAVGLLMVAGGAVLLAQASASASFASDVLPAMVVIGLGVGMVFVPVSVTAMAGIPPQHAGVASGFLMTGHEVGAALGVAVLAAVALFLFLQALPTFQAPAEEISGGAGFWSYIWPMVIGTVIAAVIALWRGSPLAFELTWFWAGSATVQALLTPDLHRSFPDYRWWWFVIAHSGVIVAAVLLAWGMRRTPRPGAVRRAFAWSLLVTGLAAAGTVLFDGNYMFLREPPEEDSLLDLMGPWPWYIASAAALALVLFWLLDRPFDGRRKRLTG